MEPTQPVSKPDLLAKADKLSYHDRVHLASRIGHAQKGSQGLETLIKDLRTVRGLEYFFLFLDRSLFSRFASLHFSFDPLWSSLYCLPLYLLLCLTMSPHFPTACSTPPLSCPRSKRTMPSPIFFPSRNVILVRPTCS
jgi:hypothetical protein